MNTIVVECLDYSVSLSSSWIFKICFFSLLITKIFCTIFQTFCHLFWIFWTLFESLWHCKLFQLFFELIPGNILNFLAQFWISLAADVDSCNFIHLWFFIYTAENHWKSLRIDVLFSRNECKTTFKK